MTTDLVPDLLALHDAPPSSPQAHEIRWRILRGHGVTTDCPTATFCWALTILTEAQENAVVLDLLRKRLMEPADVLEGLGRHPSDWDAAENIVKCMLDEGQDALRLAGRAAELVSVS